MIVATAPMEIDRHRTLDGSVVLVVGGEIDLATGEAFGEALRVDLAAGRRIVVDLGDCTFIDSTGIAVLLRAGIDHPGCVAVVAHPGTLARRVLQLTAAADFVPVHEDRDAAVRRLISGG